MPETFPLVRGFQDVLQPERQLLDSDGFHWFFYSAGQVGMALICLHDQSTGVVISTMLANKEIRTASLKAWAGARHSRAPGTVVQILTEIKGRDVNPDERLEATFKNYGHASVADMADGMVAHFHHVPLVEPLVIFNMEETYSAQDKSTRFQEQFGMAPLQDLRSFFSGLSPSEADDLNLQCQVRFGQRALLLFNQYKDLVTEKFRGHYRPQSKKETNALGARVLDAVRGFLPFGLITGHSLETSAREWSQIIARMKASHISLHQKIGFQLERLFAPGPEIEQKMGFLAEAPGLIRYTEPATLITQNLHALREWVEEETDLLRKVPVKTEFQGRRRQSVTFYGGDYSPGDKIAAQYLLSIWPGLDLDKLLKYLHTAPDLWKSKMSSIIFAGHSNYQEPPSMAGSTDTMLDFSSQLKVARDLNRHRAWERVLGLPLVYGGKWSYETVVQILAAGFGVSENLIQVPEFNGLADAVGRDLESYYQDLLGFVGQVHEKYGNTVDYTFVASLLPIAHMVDLYMSGDPKQALYMTHQRYRNGGDFDYIGLAFDANRLVAGSDPYLAGMRLANRPNFQDRGMFFDRS